MIDTLCFTEERIDFTWPDDAPETQDPKTRSARSAQAQATPRGHLEIPSSESALMTISFLTFAVFLIKLVLVCQEKLTYLCSLGFIPINPAWEGGKEKR